VVIKVAILVVIFLESEFLSIFAAGRLDKVFVKSAMIELKRSSAASSD
jgi:hypothetical protein